MKNKIVTIGIIIATLILAGVAIFTAIRLYQLKKEAVAPTAPTSKPKAQVVPIACQSLAFTLGQTPTPTPTPTGSPTATPTVSPTVTPTPTTTSITTPTPTGNPNTCNGTCGSNNNCESGLICSSGFCRNPSCLSETDCTCQGEPNSCGGTCGSNYNCKSDLYCYQGFCRNPSCPTVSNCQCGGGATATPRPTATLIAGATPTGEAALPSAGISFPTIFGVGLGTILLIGALLLAL